MLLKLCNRLSIITAACLIIFSGCESISFNNPWNDTPVEDQNEYSKNLPADPSKPLPARLQKKLKEDTTQVTREIRPYDANPRLLQGFGFNVILDGNASLPIKNNGGRQVWQIKKPISSNPTLNLSITDKIGELNRIRISINPYKNGKVDRKTIWMLSRKLRKELKPNAAIKFTSFQGVKNSADFFEASKLPAGKYRMRLQIIGDSVDEQNIDFTVK